MKSKCSFPNLRAEMARRGLTISGIARDTGKNRDTLARHFNGTLPIADAIRIRDRFFPDCDLDYLFEKRD